MVTGALGFPVSQWLTFLLFTAIVCYAAVFVWLRWGWYLLGKTSICAGAPAGSVSVVVAVRNEEANLFRLLSCLAVQDFPADRMEIILVDDHSDRLVQEHKRVQGYLPHALRVLRLPQAVGGKKQALLYGARLAKNEILLFTDADCWFGTLWVKRQVEMFTDDRLQLSIGLVDYEYPEKLAGHFFRIDFRALVMAGAASARLGHATLCNGANLAVRRSVYLEEHLALKHELPSGDDVFLLHAIKGKFPKGIAVLYHSEGMVQTAAPQTVNEFLNQRIRWGAKARYYTDRDSLILTWTVLAGNTGLLAAVGVTCFGLLPAGTMGLLLGIKITADILFVDAGRWFFSKRIPFWMLPFFASLYPLYVVVAAGTAVAGRYQWKGRQFD